MFILSVRANVIANYAGQAWAVLMGLAFIPIYIRYVGVEAYGLIGIFAVLQTWLTLLDMGMTPALIREMSRFRAAGLSEEEARDMLRSAEWLAVAVAAVVAAGIWLASDWLASEWLRVERLSLDVVAQSFSIMGIVTALRFVENVYRSSLIGLQRQVVLNVLAGTMATLRGLGAVAVLAFVAPTIEAFFLWQLVVAALSLVVLAIPAYRTLPAARRPARFSMPAVLRVWRFATGTVVLTALGFVLSQTDKLILTKLLSLEQFAYYSLALTAASCIRQTAQPVDQGIYPRLTELLTAGQQLSLAALYHRGAQLSAVVVGSFAAFLVVFGEQLLHLWMQDGELAARTYPIMALLALGMMLNTLLNGPYYLQMAAGWTGLLIRVNSAIAIAFVPGVYLLSRTYGAIGAALAWIGLNVAYLCVLVPLMHRRLLRTEMGKWFVADIAFPVLSAFAVLGLFKLMLPLGLGGIALMSFCAVGLLAALAAAAMAAADVRKEIVARMTHAFA